MQKKVQKLLTSDKGIATSNKMFLVAKRGQNQPHDVEQVIERDSMSSACTLKQPNSHHAKYKYRERPHSASGSAKPRNKRWLTSNEMSVHKAKKKSIIVGPASVVDLSA